MVIGTCFSFSKVRHQLTDFVLNYGYIEVDNFLPVLEKICVQLKS